VVSVVFLSSPLFTKKSWRLISTGGIICFLLLIGAIRVSDHFEELRGVELSDRNFYGTLKVYLNEESGYRSMRHGQISHGSQFVDPNRLLEPTTYYIRNSGVGKAILIKEASSKSIKVGVVGLGVGTLAGYGRPGDVFRFYEINPQVIEVANQNFSFLSKSLPKKELVLGDARLQLEQESSQQFDVLVVDAFSGDSVPVHLLTQEAFTQYFKHLKKDGVLALHITNRFLDLKPVMKMAADQFGGDVRMVIYEPSESEDGFRSHWALMTKNKDFFKDARLINTKTIDAPKNFKPWKDDYSSLISVMN
jgi:hypothetical protein